jgi:hypothetical protein
LGFDPEVRARIYTQWEAVPVSQHHRRTIKFMEEGGQLRAAIDAMETPTDLSNITLKRSVLAIRELPFNDETNEAPHAHFFTSPPTLSIFYVCLEVCQYTDASKS